MPRLRLSLIGGILVAVRRVARECKAVAFAKDNVLFADAEVQGSGNTDSRLLAAVRVGLILPVATLVACAVVYGVLLAGKSGIERASNILFFFIVGVGLWMVYLLLTEQSSAVVNTVPAYASGDLKWDYVTGIEIDIVSLLSWWPYIGAMVRVAPNAHTAAMPAMLGMGLPVPILSIIGLAAILALEASDPSAWMVQLGGPLYGAIALVFVIAANLGTAIIGVYATAVGLRSIPGAARMPWKANLLLALVPVGVIGVVLPDLFFNNFGTFLAFIGVFFAPLCAIQIVDFLILRRQRLDVRSLYDASPEAPYYYWGGCDAGGESPSVADILATWPSASILLVSRMRRRVPRRGPKRREAVRRASAWHG